MLRYKHMCVILRLRLAILDFTMMAMLAEPMLETGIVDETISMRPNPRELDLTVRWGIVAADTHPIDVFILRHPLWQARKRFCIWHSCRWRCGDDFPFYFES